MTKAENLRHVQKNVANANESYLAIHKKLNLISGFLAEGNNYAAMQTAPELLPWVGTLISSTATLFWLSETSEKKKVNEKV